MPPPAKRTKGVYPPLLEGMRDPRRHQRAGIASAHHPPALKTTARSEFPLELVDLATPSPSRGQARALSKASASITTVVLQWQDMGGGDARDIRQPARQRADKPADGRGRRLLRPELKPRPQRQRGPTSAKRSRLAPAARAKFQPKCAASSRGSRQSEFGSIRCGSPKLPGKRYIHGVVARSRRGHA